jgi:stearoyl-CoA desaturase (Delta-9 desaturase)
VGWIFARERGEADYTLVRELARYPELRVLNRVQNLPAVFLAVACYLAAGWEGLFVCFFLSTVLLYHGSFAINSLAHVWGTQRYATGDDSRNSWCLALLTMGEGWHNNHHYYQSATRQGFFWWEIDPTYYLLRLLSWCGLVWDLREPPCAVVEGRVPARSLRAAASG